MFGELGSFLYLFIGLIAGLLFKWLFCIYVQWRIAYWRKILVVRTFWRNCIMKGWARGVSSFTPENGRHSTRPFFYFDISHFIIKNYENYYSKLILTYFLHEMFPLKLILSTINFIFLLLFFCAYTFCGSFS